MRRQWVRYLGIMLACGVLVGCGNQMDGTEPLAAGSEPAGGGIVSEPEAAVDGGIVQEQPEVAADGGIVQEQPGRP